MNIKTLLLAGTSFFFLFLALFQNAGDTPSVMLSNAPTITRFESPAPSATPYPLPVSLAVPKLNVTAPIELVGMDKDGNMDVPKNADNVAWYELGYKPGMTGNAVVAGHVDSETGPAVFYRLSELKPGDSIQVKTAQESSFRFTVTDVVTYRLDQFPMQEVFGKSSKRRLNLITCGGKFDNTTKNYSHRVVVYSELQESS